MRTQEVSFTHKEAQKHKKHFVPFRGQLQLNQ
jgi:hypothetical protein